MPVTLAESALAVRRRSELGSLTLAIHRELLLRHLVANGGDATIWRDSGARVGATHVHIFLRRQARNPQLKVPAALARHSGLGSRPKNRPLVSQKSRK